MALLESAVYYLVRERSSLSQTPRIMCTKHQRTFPDTFFVCSDSERPVYFPSSGTNWVELSPPLPFCPWGWRGSSSGEARLEFTMALHHSIALAIKDYFLVGRDMKYRECKAWQQVGEKQCWSISCCLCRLKDTVYNLWKLGCRTKTITHSSFIFRLGFFIELYSDFLPPA